MEHINQLRKWKDQTKAAKPGSAADMDVAIRLVNHALEAHEKIDRLTAELEQSKASLKIAHTSYDKAVEEIGKLTAELAALKADAERWKALADANAKLVEAQQNRQVREIALKAQSEPVGVVKEAHDGYPWKRISYTSERLLAAAPIGAFVYLTPQPAQSMAGQLADNQTDADKFLAAVSDEVLQKIANITDADLKQPA